MAPISTAGVNHGCRGLVSVEQVHEPVLSLVVKTPPGNWKIDLPTNDLGVPVEHLLESRRLESHLIQRRSDRGLNQDIAIGQNMSLTSQRRAKLNKKRTVRDLNLP